MSWKSMVTFQWESVIAGFSFQSISTAESPFGWLPTADSRLWISDAVALFYRNRWLCHHGIINFLSGGFFLTFTVVFVLEKVIGNIKLLNYSLSYLGKNTLEIYVIYSYFLGVTHGFNSTIRVIINFCICFFITITIILCFQKNKVSTLLFGKRDI